MAPLELHSGTAGSKKHFVSRFHVRDEKEKVVTAGGPNLSEGPEPAQSLLPLLVHPLLPLLLLVSPLLALLQRATVGETVSRRRRELRFCCCSSLVEGGRTYQVDLVMLVEHREALLGLELLLLLSLHTLLLRVTAEHKLMSVVVEETHLSHL